MKRSGLLLLVGLLVAGSVFASDARRRDLLKTDSITINATATAYSSPFQLVDKRIRSIEVAFDSTSGTPDVEVSYVVCSTEDGTYHAPENVSALISSVADEVAHTKAFTPVVKSWYKLAFTGNAANPADTTVTAIYLDERTQ